MAQEKSEAIVLRGVDFSESSRIVTFLSKERGRISCMAKGARRRGNTTGPLLDTFNHVEIVYYYKESRQVQTLGEVSLIQGYHALKTNLARQAHASLVTELAARVSVEGDGAREEFETLTLGLDLLCRHAGDLTALTGWLCLRLLTQAGFAPELREGGTGEAAHLAFSYESGFCAPGTHGDRRVSAEARRGLLAMWESPAAPPELKGGVAQEILDTLAHYAMRQLDADLKSYRVMRQLLD